MHGYIYRKTQNILSQFHNILCNTEWLLIKKGIDLKEKVLIFTSYTSRRHWQIQCGFPSGSLSYPILVNKEKNIMA